MERGSTMAVETDSDADNVVIGNGGLEHVPPGWQRV
jgi:hypothetical protein